MSRDPFLSRLAFSVARSVCTLVVVVALVAGGIYLATSRDKKIEKDSWLVLDLYGEVHEYDLPGGPLGAVMGGDALTQQDLLDNLGKAAIDKRIAGVVFLISSSNTAGWAKLNELRQAVDKVQAAGKPVYAWADALDVRTLYLASSCDSVMMPTGGYMSFKGSHLQRPYVRGVLDKLGIEPHLHKIKDYKAAAEIMMDPGMSEPARENLTWVAEEVWETVLTELGTARGLERERLLELMAYAEFTPTEAQEAGLIDEVVYLQDLQDRLKGDKDEQLKTVGHGTYAKASWKSAGLKTGAVVAVVHAQGNIGGRENRIDPVLGVMMGHESIVAELQRCRRDEEVKAVVFRVDSGGGESLASDLIAHEVSLLAAVKPVVVSMVDVAASGGYYIAYKGTRMMANPLTVTGSIGSINGWFNLQGFYRKIGFNKDGIALGPMAELGTDLRPPTEAEWSRHAEAHWVSFNEWLADVARARGLEFAAAEKLAHGRTWTGVQAAGNGLIDAVGNLDDAVQMAAELAELEADKAPRIVHLPERQGLLALLTGGGSGADDPVALAVRTTLIREIRAQVRDTGWSLQHTAVNVVRP